jgi:hypothetical protein
MKKYISDFKRKLWFMHLQVTSLAPARANIFSSLLYSI